MDTGVMLIGVDVHVLVVVGVSKCMEGVGGAPLRCLFTL
jgi:hypothetical protein